MRSSFLLILLLTSPLYARAQILCEMFTENNCIDSLTTRALRIDIDAIGFFRDNEYDSEIQSGYSLPGVRLNPHLAYKPINQIDIELGASMMFFNGANRYPCYAYHDIAQWKGNQYQHGCHVLPWVRLQAAFKHIDVVVGNIHGAANHNLITPLYNPEQNLSADPEMGVQILLHRPHIQLDTWLNWQSYIFETDTHQEAFTVGTTAQILWGKRNNTRNTSLQHNSDKTVSFYTPIQLVIQHRGGEQDKTKTGVQTICNGSIGAGIHWQGRKEGSKDGRKYATKSYFNYLDAQINAIGCYQQKGRIWPFDEGFAYHAGISTKFINHITFGLDYLHAPTQFISVYGNPFYSTISLKHGGTQMDENGSISYNYKHQYEGLHNLRVGIGYSYTFASAYTLGVAGELFNINSKERNTVGRTRHVSETCFSFGLYLRVCPSLILKRF